VRVLITILLLILFPFGSLAQSPFGDGWRVVVIDGVSYVQFEESVALRILAGLEQNEIRRAELIRAMENQRNLNQALYVSQRETRKWRITTIVVSGVALGLLGVAVLK